MTSTTAQSQQPQQRQRVSARYHLLFPRAALQFSITCRLCWLYTFLKNIQGEKQRLKAPDVRGLVCTPGRYDHRRAGRSVLRKPAHKAGGPEHFGTHAPSSPHPSSSPRFLFSLSPSPSQQNSRYSSLPPPRRLAAAAPLCRLLPPPLPPPSPLSSPQLTAVRGGAGPGVCLARRWVLGHLRLDLFIVLCAVLGEQHVRIALRGRRRVGSVQQVLDAQQNLLHRDGRPVRREPWEPCARGWLSGMCGCEN